MAVYGIQSSALWYPGAPNPLGDAVGIDWTNSQSSGLIRAWTLVGENYGRDLTERGLPASFVGTRGWLNYYQDGDGQSFWTQPSAGAANYVDFGAINEVYGSTSMAISAWILDKSNNDIGPCVGFLGSPFYQNGFLYYSNTVCYCKNSNGADLFSTNNFARSATLNMAHMLWDYDGTQGTAKDRLRVYKNGVGIFSGFNEAFPATLPTLANAGNFLIGNNTGGGGQYIGVADTVGMFDLRIYQRGRFFTDREVQELYDKSSRYNVYLQPSVRIFFSTAPPATPTGRFLSLMGAGI